MTHSFENALTVQAEPDLVVMTSADNVIIRLTPEAALETADRLKAAATASFHKGMARRSSPDKN
jgi:hypothetical protein